MKAQVLSWIIGAAGMALILLAFYGRFHGAATLRVFGQDHAATSVLLVGNTVLLAGLYVGLFGLRSRT